MLLHLNLNKYNYLRYHLLLHIYTNYHRLHLLKWSYDNIVHYPLECLCIEILHNPLKFDCFDFLVVLLILH